MIKTLQMNVKHVIHTDFVYRRKGDKDSATYVLILLQINITLVIIHNCKSIVSLCTVFDGCSTKKEETLLQILFINLFYLYFFCNTFSEIRVHHFCRNLVMHFNKVSY